MASLGRRHTQGAFPVRPVSTLDFAYSNMNGYFDEKFGNTGNNQKGTARGQAMTNVGQHNLKF